MGMVQLWSMVHLESQFLCSLLVVIHTFQLQVLAQQKSGAYQDSLWAKSPESRETSLS